MDDNRDDDPDRTAEQSLVDAPVADVPTGAVGLVASELAAALSDARAVFAEMGSADKGTLAAAVGVMLSTLAPWVGVPGDPWRPGVMAGGWVLVALAVWAMQLTAARARALGIMEAGGQDLAPRESGTLRRISLGHLVCGATAWGYSLWLVAFHLWWMDARTVTGVRLTPFIRPGLPVAVFFSTGLAFAGLVRFVEDARRRRLQRGG